MITSQIICRNCKRERNKLIPMQASGKIIPSPTDEPWEWYVCQKTSGGCGHWTLEEAMPEHATVSLNTRTCCRLASDVI